MNYNSIQLKFSSSVAQAIFQALNRHGCLVAISLGSTALNNEKIKRKKRLNYWNWTLDYILYQMQTIKSP